MFQFMVADTSIRLKNYYVEEIFFLLFTILSGTGIKFYLMLFKITY